MLDLAVIPRTPRTGDIIGEQYVLDKEIGRGSMGVVFSAEQLGLDRRVAIKMLLPRALVIEGVVDRFQRGARLASALTHPNSVTIHAIGMHNDPEGGSLPYLVMEYLQGEDLYDYITRKGRLTVDEAVWIMGESLGSLAQAHAKAIIHRDLKPENLFVSQREDGSRTVKVLDFGLAKAVMEGWEDRNRRLTATGMTCGTPEYMAPEQAVGEEIITPALDIYGIGCILYHMLSGHPPFSGKSPMTIALKHVSEPPPPLPDEHRGTAIEAIILRALAKRPEVRFKDAAQLARALEIMAGGGDVTTINGWPTEEALSRPYRVAGQEEDEDLDEGVIEEETWALATMEMAAVDVASFTIPTTLIPEMDGLLFDGSVDGQEEEEEIVHTSTVTLKTEGIDLEAASDDEPYRSMRFEPGSVSVNIPNAVTVDLEAAEGVVDYSMEQGAQTVVSKPKKAHVPAPTAPVSVLKPPPPPSRASRHKATALWIMVAVAIMLGVAALTVSVLFFIPKGNPSTQTPAPSEITVEVTSKPSGAEVTEKGQRLGATPLTIKRGRRDGSIKVILKKIGYKDHPEWIRLTEDSEVEVELIEESREHWTN